MADESRDARPGDAAEPARGGNLRAEVLARMGHELRTPLNAIIGFVKLVEEGLYTTEDERRDYLANARQSALALLDLINNILDLARIEAGRLTLESVELDLRELLEEIARTLAPEAHAKGVEIEVAVDPELPPHLRSDPMRLRQVLYNLVGNGIKFTDAGLVLLRADLEQSQDDTSRVRFSVHDTGIGVPEPLQPRIFDSFVQTSTARADRMGGVGLGLSIAKQIVEQMGGTISLESRVGAGSTFWFTLALPRGSAYGARPRERPASLGNVPVLLVNPNAAIAQLYLARLTAIGAQAEAVADTAAAFARLAAAQTSPAPLRVVLLDHNLSRDDTLVFARRVRREAAWYQPDLVHLAITGAAGDAAALREAGITAFVTKPAGPAHLRGALAALLEQQREHGVALRPMAADKPAAPAPRRERYARILVAEDNAVNQKLIHALLSKHGYGTRTVANGREAIEALQHERFDLLLMDVQMPVLDGLAATRAIRQLPQGKHLPIIALTADALDGDRERCLGAGMDDYLPKPIMPDALQRKLTLWLQPSAPGSGGHAPADPALPVEPALDLGNLEAVQAFTEDHDPLRFVAWIEVFRGEVRAALDALEQPAAQQERAAWRDAAQRLALACAGFGAPHMLALARELAGAADAGEPAMLDRLADRLRSAYRAVEAALSTHIGEGRADSAQP